VEADHELGMIEEKSPVGVPSLPPVRNVIALTAAATVTTVVRVCTARRRPRLVGFSVALSSTSWASAISCGSFSAAQALTAVWRRSCGGGPDRSDSR